MGLSDKYRKRCCRDCYLKSACLWVHIKSIFCLDGLNHIITEWRTGGLCGSSFPLSLLAGAASPSCLRSVLRLWVNILHLISYSLENSIFPRKIFWFITAYIFFLQSHWIHFGFLLIILDFQNPWIFWFGQLPKTAVRHRDTSIACFTFTLAVTENRVIPLLT